MRWWCSDSISDAYRLDIDIERFLRFLNVAARA
jgi:hypothetical protein